MAQNYSIPTRKVVVKATGAECLINAVDFNEALHEEPGASKKAVKPAAKTAPVEEEKETPEASARPKLSK